MILSSGVLAAIIISSVTERQAAGRCGTPPGVDGLELGTTPGKGLIYQWPRASRLRLDHPRCVLSVEIACHSLPQGGNPSVFFLCSVCTSFISRLLLGDPVTRPRNGKKPQALIKDSDSSPPPISTSFFPLPNFHPLYLSHSFVLLLKSSPATSVRFASLSSIWYVCKVAQYSPRACTLWALLVGTGRACQAAGADRPLYEKTSVGS